MFCSKLPISIPPTEKNWREWKWKNKLETE